MAMSKIERIEKEIQKTREKITEYQNKLKHRKPKRKICKSFSSCAPCA